MGEELAVGDVIDGRFEILAPLGMGGMGSVYRARDREGGEEVALKVLHDTVGSQVEPRQRFEREARALAALDHPRIVPIRGFGLASGKPYLVMELLRGRMLTQVVVEDSPIDPARAVAIARQLLEGVAYAHAQGIIHRDLKSPNVFLETDEHGSSIDRGAASGPLHEQVRILDFGFAKFFDKGKWTAEQTLTAEGDVFGTPAYMAPEQALGQRVDARADVYALGILLCELVTGLRPFRERDRQKLYRQHISEPPPKLRELRADLSVPRAFEHVVQKALHKSREARWRDAGEMLEALDAAPMPTAGGAEGGGSGGRSALLVAAVALGVFAALTCVATAAALWLM